MLKVMLAAGLGLSVLGLLPVPLPGPGFLVLGIGVVFAAVASALLFWVAANAPDAAEADDSCRIDGAPLVG